MVPVKNSCRRGCSGRHAGRQARGKRAKKEEEGSAGGEKEGALVWYLFIFISTFSQPSIARKMCVKMGCTERQKRRKREEERRREREKDRESEGSYRKRDKETTRKADRCDLRSRSGWLTRSLLFLVVPLPLRRLQAAHVCGNGKGEGENGKQNEVFACCQASRSFFSFCAK